MDKKIIKQIEDMAQKLNWVHQTDLDIVVDELVPLEVFNRRLQEFMTIYDFKEEEIKIGLEDSGDGYIYFVVQGSRPYTDKEKQTWIDTQLNLQKHKMDQMEQSKQEKLEREKEEYLRLKRKFEGK